MADLPEYQRRTGIQPSAQPAGFTQASQNVAASYEVFGAVASNIASNAAIQRSQMAGQEAGKVPGKDVFPALTPVDAAYNKAYLDESSKVLETEANRYLNKLALDFNAIPNPSGKDLVEYQQQALTGVSQLSELADRGIQRDLQRSFMSRVDADFMQFAQKVQRTDIKKLNENFNVYTQANSENIFNYSKREMWGAFEQSYQDQVKALDEARPRIGEEAYFSGLKSLEILKKSAPMQGEVERLYNSGPDGQLKAIQYIQDYAKNGRPGHTESDKMIILPQVYNAYAQYNKTATLSDNILYGNALVEMATSPNGMLNNDRFSYYKENLSAESFNDLQLKQIRAQGESLKLQALVGEMAKDFGSTQGMIKWSASDKDKVFSELLKYDEQQAQLNNEPYTQPLLRAARYAQNIKSAVPVFQEKMTTAIKFGTPDELTQAAQAVAAMRRNNPIGLQGMDKDAIAVADMFDKYRLNTQYSGEEAAKLAKGDIYVDEDTKVARMESYKQNIKDNDLNDDTNFTKFVANGLGVESGALFWKTKRAWPAGLNTKVRQMLPQYYQRSGNWDQAKTQLFSDLKNVYQETNINNRPEIMAASPESMLPQVGFWQQNDKAHAFKLLADEVKTVKDSGGYVATDIEWDNAADFDNMLTKQVVPGDLKAKINGVERKIIVVSDDATQLSADMRPSWAFYYLDDNNIPMPVLDATQMGGIARWYPNFEELNNQMKKYPEIKLQEAKKALEAQNNKIEDGISYNKSPYWWIDGNG